MGGQAVRSTRHLILLLTSAPRLLHGL